MTDYGRPLEFGIFPIPEAKLLREVTAVVQEADRVGLDLVGIQDHPYQRRFLDTFSLIAGLATQTKRVRFFTDVANLPLRPPAVLAKTAASIDILSDGRFELGLGAGAFWDAIEGMGRPRLTPGQALRALEEAIEVIRLLWSDERGIRFEGEHYRIDGVHAGPQPAHAMEIWLGVGGPRSLALLGRSADGWLPSIPRMPVAGLNGRHAIIDEAAEGAGRDPAVIRRLANVNGVITDGPTGDFLRGPAEQWVDQLAGLALEHGIDTFILWPDGDPLEQIRRFAALVPEVRAAVAEARS